MDRLGSVSTIRRGAAACPAAPRRCRIVRAARGGQAYFETLVVTMVLLAVLFGFLQAAFLFGERIVAHHAAARAARSLAVGFDDWMAHKTAYVAAIPVSGKILAGNLGWDAGMGSVSDFELSRIPEYLDSDNHARAEYVLDYTEWEKGTLHTSSHSSILGDGVLRYRFSHDAPLEMPLSPVLFPHAVRDDDGVPRIHVAAEAVAPEHAGLYLK